MKKIYQLNNHGFSLMEIIVVIAIIGILASIIIVSLNSAREKANDATIKTNLTGTRNQAELYFSENNNYGQPSGIVSDCDEPNTIFDPNGSISINKGIKSAEIKSFGLGSAVCSMSVDGKSWAVSVPLKKGGNWCVDSLGYSEEGITGFSNIGVCNH